MLDSPSQRWHAGRSAKKNANSRRTHSDGDDSRLGERRVVEGEVRRVPGALDGQPEVEVGQHAVVGGGGGGEQAEHAVVEDRRLDARSPDVDQRPVERRRRRGAEPQPDGAVARHAHVRVRVRPGHRASRRVRSS